MLNKIDDYHNNIVEQKQRDEEIKKYLEDKLKNIKID